MIEIVFAKERETKTTWRFAEIDPVTGIPVPAEDPPVVGTLYVKKAELHKLGDPDKLRVTIEAIAGAR